MAYTENATNLNVNRSDDPAQTRNKPLRFILHCHHELRTMTKDNGSRLYICIAVVFALICAALVVVILVREINIVNKLQDRCGEDRQFLNYQFPGYFKTETEQRDFIESMRENSASVPDTLEGFSCSFQCFEQPLNPRTPSPSLPAAKRKRETRINWIYHSCCRSYKNQSSSPQFKANIRGQSREIVHIPGYRQYFEEEVCDQVRGCTGCQCAQPEDSIVQAVVYKDKNAVTDNDKYELDYLKFGGCCKCLNIGVRK